MRYREIVEATSKAERVAKANHAKAEAAHRYQERLKSARGTASDRQQAARQSYQSALNKANDSIRQALSSK